MQSGTWIRRQIGGLISSNVILNWNSRFDLSVRLAFFGCLFWFVRSLFAVLGLFLRRHRRASLKEFVRTADNSIEVIVDNG